MSQAQGDDVLPVVPQDSPPDDSMASRLLAMNAVLAFFALVTVCLRLYIRCIMLKTFGMDDGFIVAAMLCGIGVYVCWVGECNNGLGRHWMYLSDHNVEVIAQWTFFHSIIIVVANSLVKMSIGFVLLRFVNRVGYRRLIWGMIIFLVPFTIACTLTTVFSCIPVAASWTFLLKATAKCFTIETFTALSLFYTSINIATDIVFTVLPFPIIWGLQLNKRDKYTLIGVLSLGGFACIACIVKLYYQANTASNLDATRYNPYSTWASVELYIGIFAASIPSLRPLFKKVFDSAARVTRATRVSTISRVARASLARNRLNTLRRRYQRQDEPEDIEMQPRLNKSGAFDTVVDVGLPNSYSWMITGRGMAADPGEEEGSPEDDPTPYFPDVPFGEILVTTEITVLEGLAK